jgi:hypothetical protein
MQDRPSFFVSFGASGPDQVAEVDACDARSALAWLPPRGGSVVALSVSSTAAGQARLAIVLESGSMELWDVGGVYSLLDSVPLPAWRERFSRGGAARAPVLLVAATTGLSSAVFFLAMHGQAPSPMVQVVRAYPSLAYGEQKIEAADSSRKKHGVVRGGWRTPVTSCPTNVQHPRGYDSLMYACMYAEPRTTGRSRVPPLEAHAGRGLQRRRDPAV